MIYVDALRSSCYYSLFLTLISSNTLSRFSELESNSQKDRTNCTSISNKSSSLFPTPRCIQKSANRSLLYTIFLDLPITAPKRIDSQADIEKADRTSWTFQRSVISAQASSQRIPRGKKRYLLKATQSFAKRVELLDWNRTSSSCICGRRLPAPKASIE